MSSARSRRLGERTALTLSNLLPSRVSEAYGTILSMASFQADLNAAAKAKDAALQATLGESH